MSKVLVPLMLSLCVFAVQAFAETKPPKEKTEPKKVSSIFEAEEVPKAHRLYSGEEVEKLEAAYKALGKTFFAVACRNGEITPNGILNSIDEEVRKAGNLETEGRLGIELLDKNPDEVAELLKGSEVEQRFGKWIQKMAKEQEGLKIRLDQLKVVQKLLRDGVKKVDELADSYDTRMLAIATLNDLSPAQENGAIESGKAAVHRATSAMECSTAQEGQWIYFIELSRRYAALKKAHEKADSFQKPMAEEAKPEPAKIIPHRPLQNGAGRPSTKSH